MIIALILLYVLLSLATTGLVGGLFAFVMSPPWGIVPRLPLALAVCFYLLIYNSLMYAVICPMKLTITTGNDIVIQMFGGNDLSSILIPSLSLFDLAFYAVEVAIVVWFGRFLVRKYREKHDPQQRARGYGRFAPAPQP